MTGCVGGYHRWRADTGEPIARREEGLWLAIAIRLIAAGGFCAFLAYLIEPDWMRWSSFRLPVWGRWLGVAIGAANIPIAWWVYHTLGKNITDSVVTRREHYLVTTGPYRYVRHPFYLVLLACVVSGTLIAANWLFALGGGAVFALLVWRTRREEKFLLARFGEEYRAYQRRTGRFIPRLFGR